MPVLELENKIAKVIRTTPLVRPTDSTQIAAGVTTRLREIFLEAVPEILADLDRHEHDCEQLTRTAHKLKGAAGFVGAKRLWTLVADFEQMVGQYSQEQLQYCLAMIKQVLAETEKELRQMPAAGDK
ncbi:MAG: Hpt domain-containing protein [Turneriella sp.]